MSDLITQLQHQSLWDWVVLITGVLYVLYAAKNNPICWVWGIVSCSVLAVTTVTKYGLYADGGLNVFFVVMGFVGLYKWRSGKTESSITSITPNAVLVYIAAGVIVSLLCAKFLSTYTEALATTLDSFTTVFSIIGTIWLIRRYYENWMLWILVDAVYVYLYLSRGAILFAVLYFIYTIISMQGLYLWRREMKMA